MKNLQHFTISDIINFQTNSHGLTKMVITNDLAEAVIYLQGGNLTHFQPKGESEVIFGGKTCEMHPEKTLHAGIPICWPWFGPHPTDSDKPQHGFARNKEWEVRETGQLASGETRIVLGLHEDEETLELFDHMFDLTLTFTIGRQLRIDLRTYNSNAEPFHFTQALHSYFAASDIDNLIIYGVEKTPFIDLADDHKEKQEDDLLMVDRILNRVYGPSNQTCAILDKGSNRRIEIEKEGSQATTIWNPGKESGLHDLPGDTYRKFVCIETCNAGQDIITLESGASHHITQKISLA
jgi:D-hexose-6-phosphate mutarotase